MIINILAGLKNKINEPSILMGRDAKNNMKSKNQYRIHKLNHNSPA